MKDSQALEPVEEHQDKREDVREESMPMPFGIMGAAFLCNVLQYAVFLGLTMLVLMLIRIFGPS